MSFMFVLRRRSLFLSGSDALKEKKKKKRNSEREEKSRSVTRVHENCPGPQKAQGTRNSQINIGKPEYREVSSWRSGQTVVV